MVLRSFVRLPLLGILAFAFAFQMDQDAPALPLPKNVTYKCSPEVRLHQDSSTCNTCIECCKDMSAYPDPEASCAACVQWECKDNNPGQWTLPGFTKPKIHYAPDCLLNDGWHDIAGAITHRGLHHLFMGGYDIGGWHHAVSDDLVHFQELPGSPWRIHETYKGMDSFSGPCSGFVVLDDNGTACAGFRQCGSDKSVEGYDKDENGNTIGWNVPVEVRCASDDYLTDWGDPEYLYNVSYFRKLPYDPSRPWVDEDGSWYMLLSIDGCNDTTRVFTPGAPCLEGGAAMLYKSDTGLRPPESNWEQVGIVFREKNTVQPGVPQVQEMVTIDYIGGLKGDPYGGKTRVFFNNIFSQSGNTEYFVVRQEKPGASFEVQAESNFDGKGMMDWGNFPIIANARSEGYFGIQALRRTPGFPNGAYWCMARALASEDPNYVLGKGRKVMFAWMKTNHTFTDISKNMVSLGREVSLDGDLTLLQAFVPELQSLRIEPSHALLEQPYQTAQPGMQAEVYASFSNLTQAQVAAQKQGISLRFGVSVLACGEQEYTRLGVDLDLGLAFIDGRLQGHPYQAGGPLVFGGSDELRQVDTINIHAYVDGFMVEMIVNNRTALSQPVVPSDVSCGEISLFGVQESNEASTGAQVTAHVDVWALKAANNIELS